MKPRNNCTLWITLLYSIIELTIFFFICIQSLIIIWRADLLLDLYITFGHMYQVNLLESFLTSIVRDKYCFKSVNTTNKLSILFGLPPFCQIRRTWSNFCNDKIELFIIHLFSNTASWKGKRKKLGKKSE